MIREALFCFLMKQQHLKILLIVSFRRLLYIYSMLFVPMYSMYIIYTLFLYLILSKTVYLCSYATCEWPEFYVNKDNVLFLTLCLIMLYADNRLDPDQA